MLKCIVFLLLNGKIEVTVFFFLELHVVFRERFKCDIIMPSIIFSGPIIPYIQGKIRHVLCQTWRKNDVIHTVRANTVALFKTKKRTKEMMMS